VPGMGRADARELIENLDPHPAHQRAPNVLAVDGRSVQPQQIPRNIRLPAKGYRRCSLSIRHINAKSAAETAGRRYAAGRTTPNTRTAGGTEAGAAGRSLLGARIVDPSAKIDEVIRCGDGDRCPYLRDSG
jgi:hypothetical protein